MNTEPSHKQNLEENKLVNSLIKKGFDEFNIALAIDLKQLTERIRDKRSINNQAAQKILTDLLKHEV